MQEQPQIPRLARLGATITNVDAIGDDPLAEIPSLFEPPASEEEKKRRRHLRLFAEQASDQWADVQERENAVRHMLVCDPARGIGQILELLDEAYASLHRQGL